MVNGSSLSRSSRREEAQPFFANEASCLVDMSLLTSAATELNNDP